MIMIRKLLITSLLITCTPIALACTNITTKASDNAVVVGRTLEFGPDLNSQIIISPAGRTFSNKAPNGKPSLSWKSKYGSAYLNGFGIDMAVDGMNEVGLSIGALYLPGYTEYAPATDANVKNGIPYFQLGNWILSQFKDVNEVKKALKDITVFNQPINLPGHPNVTFPLHTIVTDRDGHSIVIEFANGKMQVYDNPLGILTNSPTFDWQINNLKNYVNLSPYSPKPITVDGFTYSSTGQGSGMLGLPGDTTPPSRFVRMAMLTQTAQPVETAQDAVVLSNHILSNVFIPAGFVRGEKGTQEVEITQWMVIKDLKNNVLYFNHYANPTLQSIDLKQLDLTEKGKMKWLPVAISAPLAVEVTDKLKEKDNSNKLVR